MDIGYGEGFVWVNEENLNEVVKVRAENDLIVSHTVKNKNTGLTVNYLLGKDNFYKTYSKIDSKHNPEHENKSLVSATASNGVQVCKGDLWFTVGDEPIMCEVVSIYEEYGVVWVDSYSEVDGLTDDSPLNDFVKHYEILESFSDYMKLSECDCKYNEKELQDAYNEGYASGKNQWQDSYGFEVPNNTIEELETAAYKKGLKDKESINESVKLIEYKKGYDKAAEYYKSMYEWADAEKHSEMSERELELKQQSYNLGYEHGIAQMRMQNELDGYDYLNDEAEEYIKSGDGVELVNHPKHYNSDKSGVECIKVARHRNFNVGSALKYLWRCGLKDGNSDIQDLDKAVWYLNDEVERLRGGENENP